MPEAIKSQLMVMYIGLKVAIALNLKGLMPEPIFFKRNEPTPVDKSLGDYLINNYPKVFQPYKESALDKFKREKCADLEELQPLQPEKPKEPEKPMEELEPDTPPGEDPPLDLAGLTEEESAALGSFDPEQAEFEVIDGALQCPFCKKTYKQNKGRGKFALIGHLETEHTKMWAQAIIAQKSKE